MRASVCYSEISESTHRNFLKFGTKLGLSNATEVTFSDFARKIPLGPLVPRGAVGTYGLAFVRSFVHLFGRNLKKRLIGLF